MEIRQLTEIKSLSIKKHISLKRFIENYVEDWNYCIA